MNCSAEKASRKWAYGAFGRTAAAMVTVAAVALARRVARTGRGGEGRPRRRRGATCSADGPPRLRGTLHRAAVPLPRPRPAEAPEPNPTSRAGRGRRRRSQAVSRQAAPEPSPQPSACRLALTDEIAIAPSIPDIHGAGGCGGEDLVRLEAIVLPDKRQVSVKPAAILRCAMASALADWIRTDIAPLAAGLGSAISDLDNFNSFECRGRNRVVGAKTLRARPRQCARCARASSSPTAGRSR